MILGFAISHRRANPASIAGVCFVGSTKYEILRSFAVFKEAKRDIGLMSPEPGSIWSKTLDKSFKINIIISR